MSPMATPADPPPTAPASDPEWDARLAYWRRRLGRVRLGAEPVEEQLARYRRVTWMLTAIPLALSLMFIGLFAAFQRPDVGAVLALVLFAPLVAVAWLDHVLLSRRVAAYLRELHDHQARLGARTPGGT
jgi:hypothetical protein